MMKIPDLIIPFKETKATAGTLAIWTSKKLSDYAKPDEDMFLEEVMIYDNKGIFTQAYMSSNRKGLGFANIIWNAYGLPGYINTGCIINWRGKIRLFPYQENIDFQVITQEAAETVQGYVIIRRYKQ